jgi:circadian clock protein KaiA
MAIPVSAVARPQISVCSLVGSETLLDQIGQFLTSDRYAVIQTRQPEVFLETVNRDRHIIDCLIFDQTLNLSPIIYRLHREVTLLPAIILVPQRPEDPQHQSRLDNSCYHTAEIRLVGGDFNVLPQRVEGAIAQFLKLSPSCRLPYQNGQEQEIDFLDLRETLSTQQQRLSEKLKERLGYLGIYYKRDSKLFFRNMSQSDREDFIQELNADYQEIILNYFRKGSDINPKIDTFVNKVFFADLSVSQVLELHMELMDRFAKKLKLEGRSEDILLDYRLTLIDAIAHLGEMYRRSIPREP